MKKYSIVFFILGFLSFYFFSKKKLEIENIKIPNKGKHKTVSNKTIKKNKKEKYKNIQLIKKTNKTEKYNLTKIPQHFAVLQNKFDTSMGKKIKKIGQYIIFEKNGNEKTNNWKPVYMSQETGLPILITGNIIVSFKNLDKEKVIQKLTDHKAEIKYINDFAKIIVAKWNKKLNLSGKISLNQTLAGVPGQL